MANVVNAERWMSIIKDLCQMRFATMSYFAKKYNISVKTIQRDMYSISRMIPIEIKQGRNTGGIYVLYDYTMDKAYMTCEQIELLLKIKDIVSKELTEKENSRLDYIITSYTKPVKK